MNIIRNSDGSVLQQSRNLSGIRRYVSNHSIKVLAVDEIEHGAGKLSILFNDGSSFEVNFGNYDTLLLFISRWRNVYGASLLVNGVDSGVITKNHPALTS